MPNLRDLGHKLYTGEVSYDFVGRRRRWYIISAILIAVSLLSIGIRGFQWGIEFEGGADFQVQTAVTDTTVTDMQEAVTNSGVPDLDDAIVTTVGNDQVRVQTRTLDPVNEVPLVRTAIANEAGVPSNEVAYSLIGASWGGQITDRALIALGVFLLLVTLVIWAYFRNWKMSIAALVALLHDLVLTVGIYALVGFTVTPATVIGVLTILGYSLYDTVVVFDKVRENVRDLTSSARQTYSEAANLAVNQVLVRSINTTIIGVLPVAALLFAGAFILGEGPLKDLALALFVGMISGAYSSIFIATPLLAQLKEREPEMQKLTKRVLARRAKSEAKVGATVAAGSVTAGSVDVAAYDPPAASADDDAAEPGDPTAPPRPRITVSSTQPTMVNRPTKPTSEGASGRPQPQNKPRSQRKK
jgi:preprotein translocase subunit SecF